ncbi:aldehyde reductase [Colletotrichum sojae]|uniref:Aldehyde reductase n=1 Tax=Colletotrichum sojae TaxID=2175907 RepID=A0A8H6JXC8_9PEZI|nr:aldehyde reductase [Colletotrichum sojae]
MGKFRRFGLSNYLPCEVEKVVQICKAKGFVPPTVYEGNYNPISRKPEEVFFPMLRKYNMVFYAYSPLAGGFLAKTKEEILARQCPKFDPENGLVGMIYSALYNKPSHFEALEEWGAISRTFGLTKPEMAYRWVAFHSPLDRARGDAMIIGASKLEQLREIVQWLGKGPLPAEVVEKIENVWRIVQHDAGLDNYNLNSFELDKTPDFKQMYEKAHENLPRTTQHQSSSTRSQSGIAAV